MQAQSLRILETTLCCSAGECVGATHICGWSIPPYVIIVSTSRPPDVTHVMNESRPSPFFALFRFRVLYLNANRRTKTGEAAGAIWGRAWKGKLIICHCDNQSVVAVINSRYSRDDELMHYFVPSSFLRQFFSFTCKPTTFQGCIID